jgi:RNA polymerase sigma factor (sigma-70 family)
VASDPELLAAWRDGDARAGQELFGRYFEPVSRFFANKLLDDRDDLVQETFEACVRGRDRLRDDASFRAYLFSVAFNVLKAYFRRKRSQDHMMGASVDELASSSLHDLAPGPSTIVGAVQQEQLLLEALRRIPMELQVVLEMRYWEEMSSAEIGAVLGIPAATARSRLHRGRELLERAIAQLPASRETRESTLAELEAWVGRIRGALQLSLA